MIQSRRTFLSTAAKIVALAAMPLTTHAKQSEQHGLARRIIDRFNRLPGRKGLKIWAPGGDGGRRRTGGRSRRGGGTGAREKKPDY